MMAEMKISIPELKSPQQAEPIIKLGSVSQWRARRSGELGFYRLAGRIYYSEKQLLEFLDRRSNRATTCKETIGMTGDVR